ncbi:MAG: hypothetical protein ACRDTE_06655 [Pseudonocardiaceae bacterium]
MYQTSNELLRETLGEVLLAAVRAGPGAAGGISSVSCRAVAALYLVLLNHPIDRRGRCRSCRRVGAVFGRRYRRCRVHSCVDFWLHQPDEGVLLGHLVSELNQQLPRQPESLSRTPALPSPPSLPGGSPRAGRPDPDHGGAGEPRPRTPPAPPWPIRRSVVTRAGAVGAGRPDGCAVPGMSSDAGPDTVAGRLQAVAAYQRLGWPVAVRGDQVSLNLDLDMDAVAVVIPAVLATEVADILTRRHCPPPVLAHPAMPTHRVIVAGDRFPVPLTWPTEIHRTTGTLLLPPTVIAQGQVCWVRPPVPHALQLCREIDVLAALRTAPH